MFKLYPALILFLFQTGITGNLLVVLVVLTRKHMRTTTNMYIVNMAIADIVMCLGKYNKLSKNLDLKVVSPPSQGPKTRPTVLHCQAPYTRL